MFPARQPIKYLKNTKECNYKICCVCFDISLTLLQCAGHCRKYYCISCANKLSYCNYCTDVYPPQFNTVQQQQVSFICPYTLNDHQPINSLKKFHDHCFSCPEMNESQRFIANCVKKFRCNKGHALVFLSSQVTQYLFENIPFFSFITTTKCIDCNDISLSRSYCRVCSKTSAQKAIYCLKCRPVPMTKTHCPVGHELRPKPFSSPNSLCDNCGIKDALVGILVYDNICNFDVCRKCFEILPEYHHLQPLIQPRIIQREVIDQYGNTKIVSQLEDCKQQ